MGPYFDLRARSNHASSAVARVVHTIAKYPHTESGLVRRLGLCDYLVQLVSDHALALGDWIGSLGGSARDVFGSDDRPDRNEQSMRDADCWRGIELR